MVEEEVSLSSVLPVSGPVFETGTSQLRSRNAYHLAAIFDRKVCDTGIYIIGPTDVMSRIVR